MSPFKVSDSDLEKWASMREAGRTHHVLIRGLLGWGGLMFAVFSMWSFVRGDMTPSLLAINAVIWALAGLGFGLATWHLNERALRDRQPGAV